jgi:polyisoprenoid-binding protein YceI
MVLDGSWDVTSGSQVGYRVKEILFGQRAEAVGRTRSVSGKAEVREATVSAASFTADLATVTSDQSRRDNQFRGRIMDVASHPSATFMLSEPVSLQALAAGGQTTRVSANGRLTLRGTTKPVTVEIELRRSGQTIQAAGAIPIVFAEWGIPNPSFGPADTEDRGELEFLLVFRRAG